MVLVRGDEGRLLPAGVSGTSTALPRPVRQHCRRRQRAVARTRHLRPGVDPALLPRAAADERRPHGRDARAAAASRRRRPRSAAAAQEALGGDGRLGVVGDAPCSDHELPHPGQDVRRLAAGTRRACASTHDRQLAPPSRTVEKTGAVSS